MLFCYENTLTYSIHISDQKFENSMGLLFISSHYVCIKDFDKFMFSKTKNKNKKYFCKSCWQCFSSKNLLREYEKVCLKINGEQAVKLEKGTIEFKNYCQQMPVPFKFYAGFECILEGVESNAGENAAYKFIKPILEEHEHCKKIMKKHFNKNLIMTEKEEENFQPSNTCWICKKLIEDEIIRENCHTTRKYWGTAHWKCNVNLKLTKIVPLIFHNLKGYDSHLIINEIGKFDVKVDVIPNGLEKYMTFTINKNLIFIDSMQFMNSSLQKLVQNWSDNDFKYLTW